MATSYTTLLGLALPVTGELQGTWGQTVNNSITQLCEDSIAGVATASVLSADWTLTTTGSGAANQARMAILIPTGSPGVSRNIIAPSQSKTYIVINQSNAAIVLKGAATTGVTIAAGDTVVAAWNGSDFVAVKNAAGSFTNLTYTHNLTGGTGVVNIGSGQIYKDSSGNVGIGTSSPAAKLDVTGSGRFISTNSTGSSTGAVTIRDYSTNNSTGYVQWVDNANVNQLGAIGGIAGGGLKFVNNNSEVMRIDSSGNLLVGTTTASGTNLLQVNSDALINGQTIGRGSSKVSTNTAHGISVLANNTTGNGNTASGYQALYSNTTGVYLTASGYQALYSNTTGSYNTASGLQALYSNTTGVGNTTIGFQALYSNTTGNNNTASGFFALYSNTTGSGNTALNPLNSIGVYAPVFNPTTENNRFCMGSTGVTNAYIQVAWTVVSDARDKTDFATVPHGLAFINKLKPIAYRYKIDRDATEGHGPVRYGFKAQDVLEIEGDNPVIVDAEDETKLRFNDQSLLAVMVNAIQEQQAIIESLTARIKTLEAK